MSWRTSRFRILLVSLVGLLVVYPYAERTPLGAAALTAVASLVLIAALVAIADRRGPLAWGLALGLPALACDWLTLFGAGALVTAAAYLLEAAFYGYVALLAFLEVFARGNAVTSDSLAGAVCVYLLIGVAWAASFTLLETLSPGSFHLPNASPQAVWDSFLFFSFTTLTTLGYGDITPISDAARSLANLEATTGVLYVAIMVARLVAMYEAPPAASRS